MNYTYIIIAVTLCLTACVKIENPEQAPKYFYGRVMDEDSKQGIPYAKVSLARSVSKYSNGIVLYYTAYTDSYGNYSAPADSNFCRLYDCEKEGYIWVGPSWDGFDWGFGTVRYFPKETYMIKK